MTRVLVIDDNKDTRRLMRTALEDAGHEVTEAANGRAGVQAFDRARSDLVVCDLVMQVMEGVETIRTLRAIDPAVSIVAVCGHDPHLGVADRIGASALLQKPFSMADLIDTVDGLLPATIAA